MRPVQTPPSGNISGRVTILSPGRVNLLGEHVDYNDGPVLPAAIDRHVRLTAQPVSGRVVTLHALDLGEQAVFSLNHLASKTGLNGEPLPGWALYPAGVAWALESRGYPLAGVTAEYRSNIPIGAGLSSSAAVETAFAVMWQSLGGWDIDRMDLARACLQAEVDYIGLNCGLMDQFICLFGVQDHALYFDTRTLAWEAIRFPDAALVVANSNIPHRLAESAYNQRQEACQQAVRMLQQVMPDIQALRDVSPGAFERHAGLLPEVIRRRARHVVEECDRVERAARSLKVGDLPAFGQLMLQGHASLRDLYEVSCPELDLLVETARGLPGCWGARLTGAGFGGCTVNLVEWGSVDAFMHDLKSAYNSRSGYRAEVFLASVVQGVHVENLG